MRGLAVFISDIRNCKSKEAEIKRINKELANIRSKFKVDFYREKQSSTDLAVFQGDKTLDGYQKKKYVCKLLFIFLLGHDIDFGQIEAVNLLSSNKYTEKQIVCPCAVSGGLSHCYSLVSGLSLYISIDIRQL